MKYKATCDRCGASIGGGIKDNADIMKKFVHMWSKGHVRDESGHIVTAVFDTKAARYSAGAAGAIAVESVKP